MPGPVLLLYNIAPEKREEIRRACLPMKGRPRLREVAPEEFGLTLRAVLLGESPAGEAVSGQEAETLTQEMLVMCGLESRQMDQLLAGLRRRGVKIPLKAILTHTNRDWSGRQLQEELSREREAIARGLAAHQASPEERGGEKST